MNGFWDDLMEFIARGGIFVLLVIVFVVAFAAKAIAAPLEVRSHQANLYGGRLAIAVVRVDKTVKHPVRATVYVNGLSGTDDGDWGQLWHLRLHEGRNRVVRTFFVRHWERVVPGYAARPDRWVAERVSSVYTEMVLQGSERVVAHAKTREAEG